jgi:uncharacterized protein YfaP (DUF2135 family)
MKISLTLPSGETVIADSSRLVLRNNATNTGINLCCIQPDGQWLVISAYEGAFLAMCVSEVIGAPGVICSPAPESGIPNVKVTPA